MRDRDTLKNTLRIVEKTDCFLALQGFLLDRQAANVSPGTLRFYRQKVTPFLDFLAKRGVVKVADIEPEHVRAFLAGLLPDHSPGGVHAYYRAAKAFCGWLFAEGEIDADPTARLKAPRVPEALLDPVPLPTIRAMLKQCDRQTAVGARDRSLIVGLLDTGLRAGEAMAANVGDLDFSTGALIVRKPKGGRQRVVFFGIVARRELLKYLRFRGAEPDEAPLWATRDGGRMSYEAMRDILRRKAEQAGKEPPTLHALRRSFALLSLKSGMDALSLQRLLGHQSLAVTRRYVKQTDADLQAAHAKASPVDSML